MRIGRDTKRRVDDIKEEMEQCAARLLPMASMAHSASASDSTGIDRTLAGLIRPPKVVTTTRPNGPRSTRAVKNRPSSRIHVFMRKRYGFGENFEATDRQLFQWNSQWRKWCPMV